MDNTVLSRLEEKVSELLKLCKNLRQDNTHLRSQQNTLVNQYRVLQHKHQQAVMGVEGMIQQLKKVEQTS